MAKSKKSFVVEIEAKLEVQAFDEATAVKKVEAALAANKRLSDDVHATGNVWSYGAFKQPVAVE